MKTRLEKIVFISELNITPPINQGPPLINGVLVFRQKLGEIGSLVQVFRLGLQLFSLQTAVLFAEAD
ncbi:hypothetical protein [Aquiflexum sp.]|uniref:hypothetical protein n=1 Tax=Aquiflexum sp. TaxID=1872584 RepID=UPI003594164A